MLSQKAIRELESVMDKFPEYPTSHDENGNNAKSSNDGMPSIVSLISLGCVVFGLVLIGLAILANYRIVDMDIYVGFMIVWLFGPLIVLVGWIPAIIKAISSSGKDRVALAGVILPLCAIAATGVYWWQDNYL